MNLFCSQFTFNWSVIYFVPLIEQLVPWRTCPHTKGRHFHRSGNLFHVFFSSLVVAVGINNARVVVAVVIPDRRNQYTWALTLCLNVQLSSNWMPSRKWRPLLSKFCLKLSQNNSSISGGVYITTFINHLRQNGGWLGGRLLTCVSVHFESIIYQLAELHRKWPLGALALSRTSTTSLGNNVITWRCEVSHLFLHFGFHLLRWRYRSVFNVQRFLCLIFCHSISCFVRCGSRSSSVLPGISPASAYESINLFRCRALVAKSH